MFHCRNKRRRPSEPVMKRTAYGYRQESNHKSVLFCLGGRLRKVTNFGLWCCVWCGGGSCTRAEVPSRPSREKLPSALAQSGTWQREDRALWGVVY